MEHLVKDEHYTEALRNILRRCPTSNNRKALLLLLEQSAYLSVGKSWECSQFYEKMGTIDINELMLWIQEEINALKNAMLESRLAPILDEESPPSDDFLTNQKINKFLLSNAPNMNNNFGGSTDHNIIQNNMNNFAVTDQMNNGSDNALFNNEQRKPSDEELEYLNLQALKFDNLSSDEDTDVADLIDLNNYIPQPPLQDPILIDPIENVKAHFNKNSSKETKTIFNTMNSFPGTTNVSKFNSGNPGVNNFNTQIATDLLSSFMGANTKTNPGAGFEPAIRAAFPSPQATFPARSPQQAFSAQPQHQPADPLQAPVLTRSGSHDSNRLAFESSRQPFSLNSPQQSLQPSAQSPQQAFNISPQLPHPPQGFPFRPTSNGHISQPPVMTQPTVQPSHISQPTQNGQSDPPPGPPGFFSRPPRSVKLDTTNDYSPQSHIIFDTPESPQVVNSPVIHPAHIPEETPPPPQNIFPIIRPKGTLPPPPGLPPLPEPPRAQARSTSFESTHQITQSDRQSSRHDSMCSSDTDHSHTNQEDDYSITTFPNTLESKLFKDDNATDIMYQYKVVSQSQLESFVTNGEVKSEIRGLGVFYTISPCSDPNFFVISLSGTHKAVTKAMEILLPELTTKDTSYLCTTIACNKLPEHILDMIRKLFPSVTISGTEEKDKYQINGTKGKVDAAINMIRFFRSSPEKIFGICYRLHPILYETEDRLDELVLMTAKITTHPADKIFILGSSEAEGFKYLFVHGLADSGNQYKLQRYINAQVEKLEAEARMEGSKPEPVTTRGVTVNRQNTTSDTIRYSKDELLKIRPHITEPLAALTDCKLSIVRMHGVHARDTARYGEKSYSSVQSRLGPAEDRKSVSKEEEEKVEVKEEEKVEVKEEERVMKPGITKITWP